MIGVSLFIIARSARNRLRMRLRRLREPRYLIGAVVGAAYLYFSFFARMTGGRMGAYGSAGRRRTARGNGLPQGFVQMGGSIVGLAFFVGAALGWLTPFDSAMLEFSDAEVNFLFTAPMTRRQLLVHRLLRSQLGLLFTALISSVISPAGSMAGRVRFAVAMWIVLVTARLYFTGVSLARTRLVAPSARPHPLAWIPLAVVTAYVIVLGGAFLKTLSQLSAASPMTIASTLEREVISRGPGHVVLWPFLQLAAPFFAQSTTAFLGSLVVPIAILVVIFVWVLKTDGAVQEAAAAAIEKRAAKSRAGNAPSVRARPTGLTLAPHGSPEGVFFWKNGVQTLRAGGLTLVRYIVPLVAIVAVVASSWLARTHGRGGAALACAVAMATSGFLMVLGPQVVRTDLRGDLRHIDLLKTWPVRSASVIRGEMLWPATMVTCGSWLGIVCATMFSEAAFPQVSLVTRLAAAAGAMLVAPALVFAQYLVQNSAAVFFPAWIAVGDQRPRGLEAMGQRLIMLSGVMVTMLLMFVPGVIAGGVLWLVFERIIGTAVVVPAAAVCSAIVLAEVVVGSEALAPAYERLDLMSIERAE
ncbi:MAG TPA: putative ABC exporter domain-containing protein [Vicinamibacterales bacterium]|nr:putative ABC exporter domain-containing protein [Vicinamibacterales bacterium]